MQESVSLVFAKHIDFLEVLKEALALHEMLSVHFILVDEDSDLFLIPFYLLKAFNKFTIFKLNHKRLELLIRWAFFSSRWKSWHNIMKMLSVDRAEVFVWDLEFAYAFWLLLFVSTDTLYSLQWQVDLVALSKFLVGFAATQDSPSFLHIELTINY